MIGTVGQINRESKLVYVNDFIRDLYRQLHIGYSPY